ncbi:MAG TPA: GGDEF domain-containing protein [Fibrobacteria bacterium]|nr:GGDEF domain-containing protein [Fibrobacteria bacterium]
MSENIPSQPSVSTEFLNLLLRERVVLLLLAATFGALAWQHWGMNRSILLNHDASSIRVSAVDDNAGGGTSVCTLDTTGGAWRIDYDVRPGNGWAFCGISFAFFSADSSPGIDLSGFDTLVVNFQGFEGVNSSFQTQLRTMDTNIYQEGDPSSLKHQNMILFPEVATASRNAMPLDRFVIPPWWVARRKVPVRFLNPDRHDVRELEILTSADVIRLGQGSFGIRSLEFHGKWIRQETLLKILFGVWLAYVVVGLVLRLYKSFASIRALQRQTSQLQELAEHDPLTRLHNRRGLENHLSALASRSIDPANPVMGVMMVDLDHFKTVNDTLGHDAGDEILRRLAGLIQEEMRPNNLAARWGGEEFILLLPGIPVARLLPAAEKVRARVESELQYKDHRITASIGIAHGRVEEFEALAKRADEALYRAKAAGRNRVEVAG